MTSGLERAPVAEEISVLESGEDVNSPLRPLFVAFDIKAA
jgi:hypothetical protein